MRGRTSSSGDGAQRKILGYDFCQQIKSIIPNSQAILKQQKILGLFSIADDYDAAREALTSLESELNQLNRIIVTEENNRQQFTATSQMLADRKDAEAAYEQAKMDFDKLGIKLTSKKEALELEESRLSNEIRTKTLEMGSAQGSEIVTDNLTVNKLTEDKKVLSRRVAKLQKKCCPSKEQKKELADDMVRLDDLSYQIRNLQTDKGPEDKLVKEIENLKGALKKVRSQMEAHNNDQQVLAAAKVKITEARIEYEKINEREKKQENRYYAKQSKLAMHSFLRTYIQLLAFKSQVDNIYIKNTKVEKNQALSKFVKSLNTVKDRIDEVIDVIWCPNYENQTARQIYDAMSGEDRKNLFINMLSDEDMMSDSRPVLNRSSHSRVGLFANNVPALVLNDRSPSASPTARQ